MLMPLFFPITHSIRITLALKNNPNIKLRHTTYHCCLVVFLFGYSWLLLRNIISIHPLENPKWMTRGGRSQSRSFQLNTCQNFFLAYHLYQHVYTYIYSRSIYIPLSSTDMNRAFTLRETFSSIIWKISSLFTYRIVC